MTLRGIAFAVGLAILAGTAHVTIMHAGGYGEPQAVLTIAIAVGVAIGSLAIGAAWHRKALAAWLALAILAGEAFGFLMTAERIVAAREAQQAPLRAASEVRAKAVQRVADAEAVFQKVPETTPRLTKAEGAKAAADAAVIAKSAEKGCAANCAKLLQGSADSAALEVKAARAELDGAKDAAGKVLAEARDALALLKGPPSATPLADRLGVPAWVLDLLTAALGSMAANGLACGLIAFAAHGPQHAPASVIIDVTPDTAPRSPQPRSGSVARFAAERLRPAPRGKERGREAGADLLDVLAAYRAWCGENGLAPLPGRDVGLELSGLFERAGIEVAERDGRKLALGVAIQADAPQPVAYIATQPQGA